MPASTFRRLVARLALAALTLPATQAMAQTTPAILTYDLFEATVPHVDLATCPAEFDDDALFCRAVLTHADMHVFVFAHDGDSPFVAVRVYPADGLDALFD